VLALLLAPGTDCYFFRALELRHDHFSDFDIHLHIVPVSRLFESVTPHPAAPLRGEADLRAERR